MKVKHLASLPLSKEVPDKTPQKVVDLLLCVEELKSRLNKHSDNSDKPPSTDSPFRKREEEKLAKASVSQGAIQKIVDRGGQTLAPWYEELTRVTQSGAVNHIDETSWKTGRRLRWLWVMATDAAVRFMVHPHRSYEAFESLTGSWPGLFVSDGYALYRKWTHGRQTCRLQGKRTYPHLVEAFERYLSGSKPAALFSGSRESCRSMNSAHSLLSLYIRTVTKAVLAVLCQGCFCLFPGMVPSGNFLCYRERDAL